MNLVQDGIGVSLVTLKDLRKILKIGLVEIRILTNSYNIHSLMPYTLQSVSNGYLLKIFKMSFILLEEGLVKFIRLNGLKDVLYIDECIQHSQLNPVHTSKGIHSRHFEVCTALSCEC